MADNNSDKKIELEISGMESFGSTSHYSLSLQEKKGKRTICFTLNESEAENISILIDKPQLKRPMVWDFFALMLSYYKIEVKEIVVYRFFEGIFYTSVVCVKGEDQMAFEARLSDALSLSLKFGAPIFTYDDLLNQVGFVKQDSDISEESNCCSASIHTENDDLYMQLEILEQQLQKSIEEENYSLAAELRDKIDTIKKQL